MDISHLSLHWQTLLLLVAGGSAIAAAGSALGARLTSTGALMQWARGTGAQALAALVLLAPNALVTEATLAIGGVLVVYGVALQATAIAAFFGRQPSGWIVGGSVVAAALAFTGLAGRSPTALQDLATRSELLLGLFAHAIGGSFLFVCLVMRRVRGLATRDALTGR